MPAGAIPELRVPLEDADDYPYAMSAIRFVYTGELDDSGAFELLQTRRQASFLGVEGCPKAADAALVELARSRLSGVAELYACRQLLPDPEHDPAAAELRPRLKAACQEALVKRGGYKASEVIKVTVGGSAKAVKAGEVLAWAFPDAPSMFSNPATRKQLMALSSSALEALLSSEGFGTDVEDSVLLLLAEWLANKHMVRGTNADEGKRLCRCVRLCQLSSVYFHGVLPLIEWFPIEEEFDYIAQYREVPDGPALAVLQQAGQRAGYDLTCDWYARSARPLGRSDAGHDYEWSFSREQLEAGLIRPALESPLAKVVAINSFGGKDGVRLISRGFEWVPMLQWERFMEAAGFHFYPTLPGVLEVAPEDLGVVPLH
ncbi:hypothetical protein HYH03_010995 [Edaphochlamys debaryana]|uniref:BACK domain-containing protein n=1 Tax=Edaphochlamys debaryana TaxID=47281 RepID=A0A836BWX2_9CHLO|nr:hypothetical protein HYH03_010995 [Edaphochlamys debaryana]|eukprot:KAG2490603.1 hypothetical protein HYH03_010995 [Edaphochlamys debaryana]